MANYDEIVALKEKIKADLGEVDIVVNSAGLLPKLSLLEDNPEDLLRIIKVNLLAYFWVRLFLKTVRMMNEPISNKFSDNSSIFTEYDISTTWSYRCSFIDIGIPIEWAFNL